ncbi:MAG TPA: hypothetical protein VMD05_05155, partial [Candidatus Nanoarchaeia archaeon]|nr:hypothetical protein [Candidatus Nanoarchaeia archaeon]
MRTIVAIMEKSGENVVPRLVAALEKEHIGSQAIYQVATPSKLAKVENPSGLDSQELTSPIATGCVTSDSSLNKPTIVKLDEAYLIFEGRAFATNTQMSAAEIIKKNLTQNYLEFAQSVLKNVEGEYALIITRPSGFIAARDPVGVQPLYFGETSEIAAIASNRAALWRLGIDKPKS